MNRHEVHVFANGTASIRNTELGETMHSQVGPDNEAQRVYIEQSRFAERLSPVNADPNTGHDQPLVLYDIGMGIASNALAALEVFQVVSSSGHGCRPLQIVSFENSLEGLELALSSPTQFPTQARHSEALQTLLKEGRWKSPCGQVEWFLLLGDFEKQPLTLAPEVIFYDFYSPKAVPHLWTVACFERLFEACAPRRAAGLSTFLTTYSAATFIRSALLLAGFYVGYGKQTSLKSETTEASTQLSELSAPLRKPWLDRLERSSKPLPVDVPLEQFSTAIQKIRTHALFSGA